VAAATAFAVGGTSLYALRFFLGVMEAGLLPGIAVYATHWFPNRYRARAVGGYIIGSSVAPVVGGPLSTALMTYMDGVAGLRGWQWMFVVEGLGASVLGLVVLRVLTERPADASWLNDEEKNWLETTLAAEREELGPHVSFRQVAADSRVWSLAGMFGCVLVGIYGLQLWLPQIIKELGDLTDLQVGFLSAVPPLLGILGVVVAGRSSDRTGDRKWHLAVVYGLSAIAIVGSALIGSPVLGYVLLCLTGLFIYAGNPLFWALGSSLRSGVAGAATVALINTIAQFGGLIGPWSIGLVRGATGGFTIALLVIGAFLVVAAVVAALLRVRPVADPLPRAGVGQIREEPA
jgi:MFS family permease